uniref:Uncharacterized protein n=1 Tax=Setaria viridis TaxID=4556 RepID=A0A4U6U3Y8_SETVI|nr:hypothetical protein SEVIR_6G152450v2 [Setaria viridis]
MALGGKGVSQRAQMAALACEAEECAATRAKEMKPRNQCGEGKDGEGIFGKRLRYPFYSGAEEFERRNELKRREDKIEAERSALPQ